MDVQTIPARRRAQPDADRATRLAAMPFALGGERDLALLTSALAGERASVLLEGLVVPKRARAQQLLEQLRGEASSLRQARLSQAFGLQPEAEARVRALMGDLGPDLKAAVFERLPLFQRTLFPGFARRAVPGASDHPRELWAQRLVKEVRG